MNRAERVASAIQLQYITLSYNILEGILAVAFGRIAHSIALIGFGLDSFVETFSSLIVLRRFKRERRGWCGEELEQRAMRWIGVSFYLLATYVLFESSHKLILSESPDTSMPGMLLALASLVVMPILAQRKFRIGKALGSGAMIGDSRQTLACSILSINLLVGLGLNAWLGWWWADPVAGIAMVPWLISEGREAFRGLSCCA
ncbi:MAG: cation transporter [Acidobacteria bacterium]|nr:cation transporter [Acidobacteriota bacterium]